MRIITSRELASPSDSGFRGRRRSGGTLVGQSGARAAPQPVPAGEDRCPSPSPAPRAAPVSTFPKPRVLAPLLVLTAEEHSIGLHPIALPLRHRNSLHTAPGRR